MTTPWRLLIDSPADGATNMARDEAIVTLLAQTSAAEVLVPTLRLYAWQPACLSLGRFQPVAAVDAAACSRAEVELVRRPSGGRAILHAAELTYAIIAPIDHPLLAGGVLPTYCAISRALLAGLQVLGIEAELAPGRQAAGGRRQAAGGNHASCFDRASAYEVVVGGRKLVGSAQVRMGNVVLQHGSLPLTAPTALLRTLLVAPAPDLGVHSVALDQVAGRAVDWDEAATALAAGFARAWALDLRQGALTEAEQAIAQRLRATKYACAGWTRERRTLSDEH